MILTKIWIPIKIKCGPHWTVVYVHWKNIVHLGNALTVSFEDTVHCGHSIWRGIKNKPKLQPDAKFKTKDFFMKLWDSGVLEIGWGQKFCGTMVHGPQIWEIFHKNKNKFFFGPKFEKKNRIGRFFKNLKKNYNFPFLVVAYNCGLFLIAVAFWHCYQK